MIIFGQDQDIIINMDNIQKIYINEFNATESVQIKADGIPIGKYSSLSRAEEVLKEMSKRYSMNELLKSPNWNPIGSEVKNAEDYLPFYKMPKN